MRCHPQLCSEEVVVAIRAGLMSSFPRLHCCWSPSGNAGIQKVELHGRSAAEGPRDKFS